MTARVDLKSRGQSPAELAANLDGEINFVTENARIGRSALNLLTVDVIGWTISNILSPNKDVEIECGIQIMHFNKGIGNHRSAYHRYTRHPDTDRYQAGFGQ